MSIAEARAGITASLTAIKAAGLPVTEVLIREDRLGRVWLAVVSPDNGTPLPLRSQQYRTAGIVPGGHPPTQIVWHPTELESATVTCPRCSDQVAASDVGGRVQRVAACPTCGQDLTTVKDMRSWFAACDDSADTQSVRERA